MRVQAIEDLGMDRICSPDPLLVVDIPTLRRKLLVLCPIKLRKCPRNHVPVLELRRVRERLEEPPPHDLEAFLGTRQPPGRLDASDDVPQAVERLAPALPTDLDVIGPGVGRPGRIRGRQADHELAVVGELGRFGQRLGKAELGLETAGGKVALVLQLAGVGNPAETAGKAILESRGSLPRIYRNALVFLAVDKTRLQDLDEAVRRYLAWESILGEREPLDLSPYQVKQAEIQKEAASSAVTARLPEAYQWLLVPGQSSPDALIEWLVMRWSGQDSLAARASKKLKGDELLVTGFAATRLRMELDCVPLWCGDHVPIKQVVEDFARYLYLPRVGDPTVLLTAISGGVALLTWEHDAFALADSFDDEAQGYRGLRGGQLVSLPDADAPGLLVKPDVARRPLDAEGGEPVGAGTAATVGGDSPIPGDEPGSGVAPLDTPAATQPVRFHGTVPLDSARVGRDASRIADEVISHLSGLVGAKVTVTLEIAAVVPSGTPDHVVRTVTENSRTPKFTNRGFEKE